LAGRASCDKRPISNTLPPAPSTRPAQAGVSDGADEGVEIIDHARVKTVELRLLLPMQAPVAGDRN
jgi:hypothetical protein